MKKKARKIKAEMGWSKRTGVASEHWSPRTEFIGLKRPLGRAMDPSSWRLGAPRGPAPTNLPGGNKKYYLPDSFLQPTYSLAQNLPCYRYRANADLINQSIYIISQSHWSALLGQVSIRIIESLAMASKETEIARDMSSDVIHSSEKEPETHTERHDWWPWKLG